MNKSICILLQALLFNTALAYWVDSDVGIGYRQDLLNWNIDGGEPGPNILSELRWKNLRMASVFGQLRFSAPLISYGRLNGSYGSIFSGENTDWDYHGDNKTEPFAYAISDASRGEAFELSAAWGMPVGNWIPYVTLIPVAGYSVQEQHLQFYDGLQVFYHGSIYNNTPLPDLASNYRGKWYTPFVGLDLFFFPSNQIKLTGTVEWHTGWYRGTGDWNLRTDLLSELRHKAYLDGVVVRLQGSYLFHSFLSCGILAEYTTMQTGKGINQVDIMDTIVNGLGQIIETGVVTAQGGLNVVQWQSWRILLTFGVDF